MRRILFGICLFLGIGLVRAQDVAPPGEEGIWAELKAGGHVILMRHALTEPGIGDPPGFRLGDCSTQRNLSASGRDDASHIGEVFRRRGIPVGEVFSSRWCRCLDTARLAFGKATPAPMLDSMFNESGPRAEDKIRQVLAAASRGHGSSNRIFVTHNQNILALTGLSVASGEMVVTVPEDGKGLRVIGRLHIGR